MNDDRQLPIANLLSNLPASQSAESFEEILSGRKFRLERIVSNGQRSPEGFWYDQDNDEWVLVLRGAARIRIEGEANDRVLLAGDHLLLRAHERHRVEWTDPSQPTIWLALHFQEAT
jgi:cupin 2 domain-containing protein